MKKLMLLALAAVSAMLFALPAAASAETWQIDWNGGNHAAALKFKTKSGVVSLTTTAGDTVTCQSSTGEGQYNSTTTGSTSLLFHSCKSSSAPCTTAGQPTGTIKANTLSVHNFWVNKHGVRTRGILLKPPVGGDFATFKCTIFGIGPEITVTGNGVIGEVELTAACNTAANVAHLNFQSSQAGHQTITKLWNTGTSTVWDLTVDKDGAPSTASQDGTGTIEFTIPATATC